VINSEILPGLKKGKIFLLIQQYCRAKRCLTIALVKPPNIANYQYTAGISQPVRQLNASKTTIGLEANTIPEKIAHSG
jgi:hypothetical protein